MCYCVSVESDTQSFILYHYELADKHLGEGRIYQVAVRLGDRGRRLGERHWGLQLERGSGGGEKLGGSHHVIHQPPVLLLRQTLTNTVTLREDTHMITVLWIRLVVNPAAGAVQSCAIKDT